MTQAGPLPCFMRAMAMSGFTGCEDIRQQTLPTPVPGVGEALVRMAAVGVNPADWKSCAGFLPFLPEGFLPLVPGFDGVGTVVALGEGVGRLDVGDRVAFMSGLPLGRGGTWSEWAICPVEHAVRLPDSVSFAQAATIPVAGISPREALMQGAIAAGECVLVNGGSGGTGIFAVQIARAAGARVAATAGPDNQALLRAIGVECAIDYRSESIAPRLAEWAPDGVDLLLDTVGQGSLTDPAGLIRQGGRYVAIETMLPDEILPGAESFAARGITAIRASASFERLHLHLTALVGAVSLGEIAVPPIEILPISQAAAALARVREGHVKGKIVLTLETDQDWTAHARAMTKDL